MKKILITLATVVLTSGTVFNPIFYPTRARSNVNPTHNFRTTNESAGDICKKLWGKTIGLHASYWVGKDIFDYHQQLANAIVKQGILTQEEVQYVSWGHLLINEPKHYSGCDFTIKKDGVTSVAKYITLWVSEIPQDIANKLNHQQIKLDPTIWMGRNLANYQQQLNQVLVKENILDKYEAQYVHWSSFVITAAKYYWSCSFAVWRKDPQYEASGIVSLNVTSGETTKQIATKLEKANIQFNYNYWKNKTVTNYLTLIRSILVNEKILTKAEASEIVGFLNPVTITKPGLTAVNFNVNDSNTNTYAYTNLNVLDDGKSADQLAAQINPSDVFRLKTDAQGNYADSNVGGVFDNIRQQLVYYNIYDKASEVEYIWPPHLKLQDVNKNFVFTAIKDGQIAQSSPCTVVAHTYAYMSRDVTEAGDFEFSANLTPHLVTLFYNYFQTMQHANYWLGYFYQMLNNGGFDTETNIPSGSGIPQSFHAGNTLGSLMSLFLKEFWDEISASDIASDFANTNIYSIGVFADDLNLAVADAYGTGNGMGVSFCWHIADKGGSSPADISNAQIIKYSFW